MNNRFLLIFFRACFHNLACYSSTSLFLKANFKNLSIRSPSYPKKTLKLENNFKQIKKGIISNHWFPHLKVSLSRIKVAVKQRKRAFYLTEALVTTLPCSFMIQIALVRVWFK